VPIEDHTLAHLRAVITSKLRKRESFSLTIPDQPQGHVTVWMDASIPVAFRFADDETGHQLNGAWLLQLAEAANRPAGLHVTAEPPLREPPIALVG